MVRACRSSNCATGAGRNVPCLADDGFPFPDADQWQIRLDRKKFNELNNDHSALMLQIEAGLCAAHAVSKDAAALPAPPLQPEQTGMPSPPGPVLQPHQAIPLRSEPIAPTPGGLDLLVSQVMEDGPAEGAGLQLDDVIIAVNGTRLLSLGDFTTIVRTNIGSQIKLAVRRGGSDGELALQLTPSHWSGPGVLGMRVRPVQ